MELKRVKGMHSPNNLVTQDSWRVFRRDLQNTQTQKSYWKNPLWSSTEAKEERKSNINDERMMIE